jgi:multiple sugar transport system substrate-binding protein
MKFKRLHKIVLVLTCILLVAGCTSLPDQNKAGEKRTVRIMVYDESYFYQEYGDLFNLKFPNTQIEIVSSSKLYDRSDKGEKYDFNEALCKFLQEEQPDVLLLEPTSIQKLAVGGKLVELQPLIDRDKYDLTTYSQGVLESLKKLGDGKLFALTPQFNINAIFYNADLFKKYGVEPPHDGMTWQEVFDTARRFPIDGSEKERVYGFELQAGMSMDELVSIIGNSQGLLFYDKKTKKITINTDTWKNLYKMTKDMVDSKALYLSSGGGSGSIEESQPFLNGRAAMTVNASYYLNNIKQAATNTKDYKGFELGIAAGPVDHTDPTKTRGYVSTLFAIRADSSNIEAAWDFVKFANGEEVAKVKSKLINYGLSTRQGISKEYNGVSLEPFYKLQPRIDANIDDSERLPSEFIGQYYTILNREVKLFKENKKTVDEALNTVQVEAQVALDQAFKVQGHTKVSKGK